MDAPKATVSAPQTMQTPERHPPFLRKYRSEAENAREYRGNGMATIREVFGAGSFAGMAIPFMENYKIEFLTKAPGGLLVFGLLIALIHVVTKGKAPVKKSFSCEGCPNAGNCHSACGEKGVEA